MLYILIKGFIFIVEIYGKNYKDNNMQRLKSNIILYLSNFSQ